jgi:hypothetical protein
MWWWVSIVNDVSGLPVMRPLLSDENQFGGAACDHRAADIVKPDAWVRDRWRVVGSSGFDDEDLRAGRGQFRSQDRTGRPAPTTMKSY